MRELHRYGILPQSAIQMREKDRRLKIATPAPELLMKRLLEWDSKGDNRDPTSWIISNYDQNVERNKDRVPLEEVIMRMVMGIAWQGERYTIDSLQYPVLCRRVWESLGTQVVTRIAENALADMGRIEKNLYDERMVVMLAKSKLLAEAAIAVLEETDVIGFQHWPIVLAPRE